MGLALPPTSDSSFLPKKKESGRDYRGGGPGAQACGLWERGQPRPEGTSASGKGAPEHKVLPSASAGKCIPVSVQVETAS